MNKLLKSTLIAGGVMGAFFASDANAQSFNVVIDEIELVSDATNYISTAATVYKPSVGVGAATTTTVDFFADDNELYNLEKPSTGVYESMIVHFTTAEVSGSTTGIANVDLTTEFDTALFHNYGGRDILVFGALGTAGGALNDIIDVTGATTAIAMQPVVVTASGFSIPEFNWNFPASSVEESSTAVSLVDTLDPFTLARNVDSSDVPDFMLEVDASVFDGMTGFTSGTSNITVGLFGDSDLGPRPMFSQTFRPGNQVGSGDVEVITFYDVPAGDIVPVAWFDADNDTMLDQGEYVTMHDNTIATAVNTVATTDVSYTADNGILDAAAVAFGYREFDVTIPMAGLDDVTSLAVADAAEFNIGGITATADTVNGVAAADTSNTAIGSLDVTYDIFDDGTTQVTRAIALAAGFGVNTNNAGGATDIDSTDVVNVVLANAAADSVSGVTYTGAATNTLVISGIPYTDISVVSAENTGAYRIQIVADENNQPDSTAAFTITEVTGGGDETEAPVAGSITVVVGNGDASDTDGIVGTIDLGNL